jgi:hypothetical protein
MKDAANETLADHIAAALAPCRFEGLLSRRNVADICRSEGSSLPPASTSLFGFECRLQQEEPVADFLVRIGADPDEWPVFERDLPHRSGETWRRIEALLRERAKSDSPLSAMLQNLWLEYDLVDPNAGSEPSVFFGTNHLTRKAESGWAVSLAEMLRGEPLSGASRNTLAQLIALLPENAKVFQVGVMCSRSRAPLRICVIGQEVDEICGFLAATRWPGEVEQVAAILAQYMGLIDRTALDFDILDDGRLAPKLGIELYQKPNEDPGPRMIELVTRLRNSCLCAPEKAIGLLAWSGITHERLYRDRWPDSLIARKILRGGNESSTFCRWLHHIKIVLEPGAAPSAKAYLAVGHAYLADSIIREALQKARPLDISYLTDCG